MSRARHLGAEKSLLATSGAASLADEAADASPALDEDVAHPWQPTRPSTTTT